MRVACKQRIIAAAAALTTEKTSRCRGSSEGATALRFGPAFLRSYRQSVLGALQETENALVASVKEQERRRALESAVAANRKAVAIATTLYS